MLESSSRLKAYNIKLKTC